MDYAAQLCEESQVDRYYIGYLEDSLAVLERAEDCLKISDAPDPVVIRAEVIAHKIKGNAALYELPQLGEIAKEAETALKSRESHEIVLAALSKFVRAVRGVVRFDKFVEEAERREVEPVEAPVKTIPAGVSGASGAIQNKKALLVFSEPWFEEFLGTYFQDGVRLHIKRSSTEAIQWLSSNTPDVIVCESDLPDMPGLTLMKFIKGNGAISSVPFVVAFPQGTGFDEISEAIAGGAAGILDNKSDAMQLAEQMRELLTSDTKRVLIIDDDEPVQELLKHSFSRAGFTTDIASDGIEALMRIAVNKPDLIILDRLMPRMNGETTLRELQASFETGSVPVIVLTAMDAAGEASKWLMRGASEFIAKPFDPDEVLARANKLLSAAKAG